MAKKSAHGGKREGAGRRPSSADGPTEVIAVSVPSTLVERLDTYAKTKEWNRSKAVTEAIRGLVRSPKRRAKG